MPSNKGIVITAPRHAEIKDLPYPKPRGADWVVVKATALAVNPTDWYHVDLDGAQSCEGCVTGFDFAGKIVETAPGAPHGFKLGDRVFGSTLGS
jgi:NADPH:quinone reductase-like Zn-dependent oxidoreductase